MNEREFKSSSLLEQEIASFSSLSKRIFPGRPIEMNGSRRSSAEEKKIVKEEMKNWDLKIQFKYKTADLTK